MNIPCLRVADIEVPAMVGGLYELAYNFWWSWNPRARRLFDSIDSKAWNEYRNPVELLINLDRARWEVILQSETLLETYNSVMREFRSYCDDTQDTWFARHHGDHSDRTIAYFSSEYGLNECFNIYSGGLGVLSGDHCKAASDLGLPFVAVGLLYRRGYFRQAVDADGRQQHIYPIYDFTRLPVRPVAGPAQAPVVVEVDFPDRKVRAKVWVAQVGRVPLLLLDTDLPQNHPADRPITSQLYVRGREMRLVQERLLGVGGVKALRALSIDPSVWHINEGHSAFLQLERLRELASAEGRHLPEHFDRVRQDSIFTTHTPVPAGNEQFDPALVQKYFETDCAQMQMSTEELMSLGSAEPGVERPDSYNLTALAIRTTSRVNGVSKLHARVSQEMWSGVLAECGGSKEVAAVTNGVHTATWLGPELLELYNRHLGFRWREEMDEFRSFDQVLELDGARVWAAHEAQKERLGRMLRRSLGVQLARHGCSPDELRHAANAFDPHALTIGFARRFATYKRASLVFSDMQRVRTILESTDRPVQIILAGKAHPADHPGQELIQSIYQLSQTGVLEGRIFFLEDYDMRIGRLMVQGVDVWLNTPLRPMEASGTSGQKAGANGVLNFSILDGWWPEAYDGLCGWAIGDEDGPEDPELRDQQDAELLYATLEEEIVPLFYRRNEAGLPEEWVMRMKHAMARITPRFSASRMVEDYVEWGYRPAMEASEVGSGPGVG